MCYINRLFVRFNPQLLDLLLKIRTCNLMAIYGMAILDT